MVRRDPALWETLIERALPLVDFYFAVTSRRLDLGTAHGKAEAVDELTPLIAEVDNEVERQHYVHQLSRLVQVEEYIIDPRVRAAARPTKAEPPAERRGSIVREGGARGGPGAQRESAAARNRPPRRRPQLRWRTVCWRC